MEILAFTHIAVDHEHPHGRTCRSINNGSAALNFAFSRWIGLSTTALSLALIMAAPGAMAMVRRGDTGQEVSLLQNELRQAGYNVGTVDGIFGQGTENALISFQLQNGLAADGIAGPITFAKLEEVNMPSNGGGTSATATVLSLGSSGDAVMALQTKLQQLGFFPSSTTISSYYGPITVDAVRRFQQANSLGADGMAGPATQAKLFGNDAVSQDDADGQLTTMNATPVVNTPNTPQMLAFGQQNNAVVTLQDRLKVLGYLPTTLNSTGYFGTLTLEAVKAFQGRNGLTADGVVGSRTQIALSSPNAIAAPTTPISPPVTPPTPAPVPTNPDTGTILPGSTVTVRTNGGPLNVRSAPNTTSSTIRSTLANGVSVEAKGVETAGWIEIEGGWISKEFVVISQ